MVATLHTTLAYGGSNAIYGDLKNLFAALAAQGAGKNAVIIAATMGIG